MIYHLLGDGIVTDTISNGLILH